MIKVAIEQVVGLCIFIVSADLMELFIQVREVSVEIDIVCVTTTGQPVTFCLEVK